MIIELLIYLVAVSILGVYLFTLFGKFGGCFYHKNDDPLPENLKKEIKNIHYVQTPAWYCLHFILGISTFAMQRIMHYTWNIWDILIQLGLSSMLVVGVFLAANYKYQKFITGGRPDNELDKYDQNLSEFAFWKWKFWKKQIFYNERRKVGQWVGITLIFLFLILFYIFNNMIFIQ